MRWKWQMEDRGFYWVLNVRQLRQLLLEGENGREEVAEFLDALEHGVGVKDQLLFVG